MTSSFRLHVAVLVVFVVVASSGCVTTQPTVTMNGGASTVFESVSTTDAWGTTSIETSVSLASNATTSEGVTRLTVITAKGGSFYSTSVDTGQTSVVLPLPAHGTSMVVAANTVNGTTVGTTNVTVGGNVFP